MTKKNFQDMAKYKIYDLFKNLCKILKMTNKQEKLKTILYEEFMNFAKSMEEILDSHNLDSDDVLYVKIFLQALGKDKCMEHTIKRILPYKKQIEKRDQEFFQKNKKIFGELPQDRVDYFSDLIVNEKLTKEDKNEIWDFFEAFVACADEYKKLQK